MNRQTDRAVIEGNRAWWNSISQHAGDPFQLDGYGAVAQAGGEELLRMITTDVRRKLELGAHTTLLEVGCGAGAICNGLANDARRTTGADLAVGMLRQAQRLNIPRSDFCAVEGARLAFAAQSFDRALCYSVFNNFPSLDYARAVIHELVRAVKPGGIVLIGGVPNVARQEEYLRDYAARFGGVYRANHLRAWLAARKKSLRLGYFSLCALVGKPVPPALEYLYYDARFFQDALTGTPHAVQIENAYNLLWNGRDAPTHADYRFDVLIRVG